MLIGVLSKRTGCDIETIRYYERIGVMPKPPRTEGGHRVFSEDHLKRLTFIRRSRELGFTLVQVRDLLGLVDGNDYTCDEVKAITVEHADAVRQKIADLRKLKRVLDDMVSQCDRGDIPDCPVIEALFEERS
ncbi:MAG: helix-turn-helix domain-containing protein [Proteobacteria bacterium]|nr:helix-turn-helix domain-containing protein [Pseudomonadota bacterium]